MKIIIQRSLQASVTIANTEVGAIDYGFVVLVGFGEDDTTADIAYTINKMIHLRIFEDEDGKMNRSLLDVGGQVLSISQFTLFANTKKGRRPSFTAAAAPEKANALYEAFNLALRTAGITVATGQFGADMQVSLTNDGPVTITIDSKKP
ncbi:D-aminoacyl-tRNA deacylase [Brochothrix campestris]|uniref:D-aminoacyl-tRNA deacylase n=1 Tax=Brochothrix campestris FSL F6-1037 TaxID=1265861 RepID=W7CPV8_9LIST|nr:D-aminoacyl-tRNA deacylase [Brochothrix campestris]EUJ41694.1 D-tyrosyl-tRNA(Tyr) deacylase [Brochothrix campestris FSL F6-1037]